jgi:calcineurin-like phosphoesterase family protein
MQYCDRPFSSIEEMNEKLISNWNSVVDPDATVFHLGDFAFGTISQWEEVRSRLNGEIHLILGNHDFHNYTNYRERLEKMFASVTMQQVIEVGKHKIWMNHYPFLTFAGIYREKNPAIELFGHVHLKPQSRGADTSRLDYALPTQYDVGVDLNNFTPVPFSVIHERIQYQRANNTNVMHWAQI